jgi:hypothetical protein
MKAIGVALLAALVLAACGSTAQSFAPERSMTPATQRPSDIPPTPLPTVSVESTPLPTPGPEPTLTGEFPGPGATVPPGTHVLSDLRLQPLADLWASLGLACESHANGGSESPADYTVHCKRGDIAADVGVGADADYWTPDGIVVVSVNVVPSDSGSIDATVAAIDWVFPFARLAGGEEAVTFVQNHIEDAACDQGCTESVHGSQLSYYSGSRGAQELFYMVQIPSK